MIIVVVYIIDFGSKKLRERYIRGDDYLQGDERARSLWSTWFKKFPPRES